MCLRNEFEKKTHTHTQRQPINKHKVHPVYFTLRLNVYGIQIRKRRTNNHTENVSTILNGLSIGFFFSLFKESK